MFAPPNRKPRTTQAITNTGATSEERIDRTSNAISAATIAELTGEWDDKYRPFATGLLFPRNAASWVADEIARGRRMVIVTGPPLSGKSNVLRELYEKYQAAADTVFLFIEGSSSRHGLFQLIADVFRRELSWNLTADQARQWLASVAANAAFHGLVEPVVISLMEAALSSRNVGEQLVSEAVKHESAPMLARLMVAFRAITGLEDPQRCQWAQSVLTQRIEPEFERVTR